MTERYIYCLYSGESFDWNSSREILPSNVLVLKHDGVLVDKFLLEKKSISITIENGSILYASCISPDSGIARYDISNF